LQLTTTENGVTVLGNGAGATSKGGELSVTARPLAGWQLSAAALGPRLSSSPLFGPFAQAPDLPTELGEAHFLWLQAAQERRMPPMAALLAATRDIAIAYKKDGEPGTLETGKRADLVILDADPLADARNYRRIHLVIKDGKLVDRDSLPSQPVLTGDGTRSEEFSNLGTGK